MGTESLVGWDLLTQSGNMTKDCDTMASNLLANWRETGDESRVADVVDPATILTPTALITITTKVNIFDFIADIMQI